MNTGSRSFRQWNTGTKLTSFTITLAAALFFLFIVFITQVASGALEKRANELLHAQAEGVANMLNTASRTQLGTVEKFGNMFKQQLPGAFSVDSSRQVDTGGTTLPVLQYDGQDLNLDFSAVDRFTTLTGGNATIFVKKGDDFFRVSTSVKKADGNRAVGTNLGRASPAYEKIAQGQTYRGLAVLFGKPHVTEYAPIKDAAGNIIGILYVGIDITADVGILKERIKSLKVGETGHFFVLDARSGDNLGTLLVHPSAEGGKNLGLRDVSGREFIKEMLESKEGRMRVTPVGEDGKQQREQILFYQTNKDWNWTIAGVAYADEVTHEVVDMRNIAFGVGILALIGFAAALLFIVRGIVSRPLAQATAAAEQLARGDLTVRLHPSSQDEIGRLMTAMNGISNGLSSVVSTIRQGTDEVALTSAQIAEGNQDLSARTAHQAGSLQQTAASMEEFTSSVRQNADNARQANQLAASASEVASRGGAAVSAVVATMGSINDSSKKIVDIIGVIDGIAFQTNILALNAAVEAARAGEQGRGFAVVASEVRSLAQRSAGAAREIKSLIDDSVQKVEAGSQQVVAAGRTMEEVVDSVHKVNGIMTEILNATQEQSSGIEQVNQAIGAMDQVTQQNAALVEEAAAAAQAMQQQAGRLAESVSVFRTDNAASGRQLIA